MRTVQAIRANLNFDLDELAYQFIREENQKLRDKHPEATPYAFHLMHHTTAHIDDAFTEILNIWVDYHEPGFEEYEEIDNTACHIRKQLEQKILESYPADYFTMTAHNTDSNWLLIITHQH